MEGIECAQQDYEYSARHSGHALAGKHERGQQYDLTHDGEVQAGGRRIWLHRVSDEHGLDTPQSIGRAAGGMVVHVDDVDAHCERARAAGADITSEPRDQDYGQREYAVRDPEGHSWWIATPTAA